MPNPTLSFYDRYLPWRRFVELGFWPAVLIVNGVANSLTKLIDLRREHLPVPDWAPPVWEFTSALAILALIPAIAAFTRRYPMSWDALGARLLQHLGASVVFSVVHVAAMVALRVLIYRSQGSHYDFTPWARELFYEYLKDVRAYALFVLVIETYCFLMRRGQGEASLLAAPDSGAPVEPVDKPERFLVRKLGREFLIAAADIEWLQASGNYVNLRVGGRDYPLQHDRGHRIASGRAPFRARTPQLHRESRQGRIDRAARYRRCAPAPARRRRGAVQPHLPVRAREPDRGRVRR